MGYELEEAKKIARRLADRLQPDEGARDEAAERLLDAIASVLEGVGFETKRSHAGSSVGVRPLKIMHKHLNGRVVHLFWDDPRWGIQVDVLGNTSASFEAPLDLHYDAASKTFVGKDDEGLQRPQHAATVVLKTLDEKVFGPS